MTDLNEQAAQAVDMASIEKAIGRLLEAWVPSIASKQAVDERIAAHAALLTEIRAIAAQPANVEGVSTWQERVMGMELNGMTTYNAMKAEIEELRAALSRRPAAAAEVAAEPELMPLPTLPQYLLNLIADYGLARTEGVSEPDRLCLWTSLIDCIKAYASDYARAHLRAAGQGSEQESMTFSEMQELIRAAQREMAEIRAGQGKDSERLDELMKVARESLQMHDLVTGGSDYGYISPKLREVVESIDAAMKAGAQGGGK